MSKDKKNKPPAAAGATAGPAAGPAPSTPEITPCEKEIRRRMVASGGALSRSQAEEAVKAQEANDARLAEAAKP